MPAKVTKRSGGGYQVRTPTRVHAKSTSKAKAEAQARLLNAVEHSDWRPTGGQAQKHKKGKPSQAGRRG
mgnify:CR=1 FL=1